MDQTRDAALGPVRQRTSEIPVLGRGGGWTGGTAYERSARAQPVRDDGRAYTNANSYQPGVAIAGPMATLKVRKSQLEDDQKLRRDITIVS